MRLKSFLHLFAIALLIQPVYAEKKPVFSSAKLMGDFGHMGGSQVLVDGFDPVKKALWMERVVPVLNSYSPSKAERLAELFLSNKLVTSHATGGFIVKNKCATKQCVGFTYDVSEKLSKGRLILQVDKLLPLNSGQLNVYISGGEIIISDVVTKTRGIMGETVISLPIEFAIKLKEAGELLIKHAHGHENLVLNPVDLRTIETFIELSRLLK